MRHFAAQFVSRHVVLVAALIAAGPPFGAGEIRAQLGHPSLGAGNRERPLHVRLALADAAVIGTVESTTAGRIRIRTVHKVFGDVPDTFEIKRAPSHPPRLTPGSRAVLLLRGDRPPYVLVDEPDEIARISDDATEHAWQRALDSLRALPPGPDPLRDLYVDWLSRQSTDLVRSALIGLGDPEATYQPLAPSLLERIARTAVDPTLDPEIRRTATDTLILDLRGRRILLAHVPGEAGGADSDVFIDAVRAGLLARIDCSPALLRALRHSDVAIRRAAVQFRGIVVSDPELRAAVEDLAAADPDPELRRVAERALDFVHRIEQER